MTDSDDPTLARISAAHGLFVTGDRPGARDAFTRLHAELGPTGDPLHRCVLAHYMADAQDDAADELAWDLAALEAWEAIAPGRALPGGIDRDGFAPSLHLNVADSYRRVGRIQEARAHAALASAAAEALAPDGYGAMIRGGVARLSARLEAGE